MARKRRITLWTIGRRGAVGGRLLIHLMYCSNRTAREALPLIVEGLARRGFGMVTVSELLREGRAAG